MIADLLSAFGRANIAGGAAVLGVMALRLPVRRLLGPHAAYALWLAAPAVFVASLIPGAEAECVDQVGRPLIAALPSSITPRHLADAWFAGGLLAAGLMIFGQLQFMARARRGLAGPAVVGVICPRLVTPRDFQQTFSDAERALIRAHERAHIDRNDPKANALITAAQVLCWFNPLVHLAGYFARLDQELACDATVMATRSRDRRLYAETMLKTQLGGAPLPLGCHWLAGAHPLEVRIGLLKRPAVSGAWQSAGVWGAAALTLLAGYGAWAAQPLSPPRPHFVQIAYVAKATELRTGAIMVRMSPAELAALPQPPAAPRT